MGADAIAIARGLDGAADGAARYRRLADVLRASIVNGELTSGTRLPSERRLAREASVSRTTVVAAYNLLRADTLVVTRCRRGTWVTGLAP